MNDWVDQTEQRLLDAAQPKAGDLGWSAVLVTAAGRECGLSEGEVMLLLPHGPADLAALKSRRQDADALATLPDPEGLKIRERIGRAAAAWLDAACAQEAATRRWAGWLALPTNLPLAGRLAWETADKLWRWAGDTATDENHYSKRAILAGILTSALAVRLAEGRDEAEAYVARRIDNVMAFEKWKATTKIRPTEAVRRFGELLGRLRYGRSPAA